MQNRTILETRVARIKGIDFAGHPPDSLVRVLSDFLELADTMPLEELHAAIDFAVANARKLPDGGQGFKAPRHALEIVDEPQPHQSQESFPMLIESKPEPDPGTRTLANSGQRSHAAGFFRRNAPLGAPNCGPVTFFLRIFYMFESPGE